MSDRAWSQDEQAWARRQLDQALDLRGNYLFGCIGSCCIGCATWKRCFLMLPQWSMVLAAMGLTGALVPWAFAGSLQKMQYGGKQMHSAQSIQQCSILRNQIQVLCRSAGGAGRGVRNIDDHEQPSSGKSCIVFCPYVYYKVWCDSCFSASGTCVARPTRCDSLHGRIEDAC